jgi:flagellar basal body-associated protein FliL
MIPSNRESLKKSSKRVTINEKSMKHKGKTRRPMMTREDEDKGGGGGGSGDPANNFSTASSPTTSVFTSSSESSPPVITSETTPSATSQSDRKSERRRTRKPAKCIYDFFCAERIQRKSIKMPSCNVSRGQVIAIIFLLLISSLILWFLFSSDSADAEDEYGGSGSDQAPNGGGSSKSSSKHAAGKRPNRYKKLKINKSSLLFDDSGVNGTQTSPNGQHVATTSTLYVLLITVLIVIAIVLFVFFGALIHYYKRPNPYMKSRSQSVVSSIFSHQNPHSYLYYLDKDEIEANKIKRQNEVANANSNHGHKFKAPSRKNTFRGSKKHIDDDSVNKLMQNPENPVIVVNETK